MDDIILKKAQSIERCILRVIEEYESAGSDFENNFTSQDAAILNLQRACEQSIDLANHLIRKNRWGLPNASRDSFDILITNNFLSSELGESLKRMVGFRNIAIHEYDKLNIEVLINIITKHLDDFKAFIKVALSND